jgi:hypothetical protein
MRGRFGRVEVGTLSLSPSLAVEGAGRRRASVFCGLIERSLLLSEDIFRCSGGNALLACGSSVRRTLFVLLLTWIAMLVSDFLKPTGDTCVGRRALRASGPLNCILVDKHDQIDKRFGARPEECLSPLLRS